MIMEAIKERIRKHARTIVTSAAGDLIKQYCEAASKIRSNADREEAWGGRTFRKLVLSTIESVARELASTAAKLSLTNNTLDIINDSLVRIADTISDATEAQRAMAIESRFVPAVQEELAQTIERSEPKSKRRTAKKTTKRATTKKKTTKRSKKK
jgi:hypothetical protein